MKLIVGLGNPGPPYAKTRHNIGQRVVGAFLQTSQTVWKKDKTLRARWIETKHESHPFIAALPESFMNESGEVVRKLVDHFQIDSSSDLLIVVDDVALPLGRLRLRASGEDGGHRGLKSIEETLGSRAYARLRIGIAPSSALRVPLEEFVLESFRAEEEKRLKEIIKRSVESCRLWVSESLEKAMNFTNKPLDPPV